MPRKRSSPYDPEGPTFLPGKPGRGKDEKLLHPDAPATQWNPGDGSLRLANPVHERLARLIALKNYPEDKAYVEATGRTCKAAQAKREGRRIARCTEAVVRRINYLTQQVVDRSIEAISTDVAITRDRIEKELWDVYGKAVIAEDYRSAIRALELFGYDRQMFIKKSEHLHRHMDANASPEKLFDEFTAVMKSLMPTLDEYRLRRFLDDALRKGVAIDIGAAMAEMQKPELPAGDVLEIEGEKIEEPTLVQ